MSTQLFKFLAALCFVFLFSCGFFDLFGWFLYRLNPQYSRYKHNLVVSQGFVCTLYADQSIHTLCCSLSFKNRPITVSLFCQSKFYLLTLHANKETVFCSWSSMQIEYGRWNVSSGLMLPTYKLHSCFSKFALKRLQIVVFFK